MIADFSGMLPLRDPILLPDNNAQLANNAWLYRGQVRGFRSATPVYTTQYADTLQIYRIPTNNNNPPDFTSTGSLWLEFPDPFMATIRNPTVGDTFNRYYFFPSDQYNSKGDNPAWPIASPGPMYNTLVNLQSVPPVPGYILGMPVPSQPPTVTPPSSSIVMNTTVASLPPSTTLTFGSSPAAAGVLVGMNVIDLTSIAVTAATTLPTALGTSTLNFSSTTGILVGSTVKCTSTPAVIFPGTTVAAIPDSTHVTLSINVVTASVAGDTFEFDSSNQIIPGTVTKTVSPSGSPNTVTLSSGVTSGGVQIGDHIQFLTAVPETRAYGYTYVNDFAEEGQISPVTVRSGDGTGTWIIVIPQPPAGYNIGRAMNPGHYRLYRTVTDSSGNATYFQVTEVPINPSGPVTITDSALDANITSNLILDTVGFAGPPAGLQGVVMMANGIAAGFAGTDKREVWFSAAFLPHAWPPEYALTVDYPIVGLTANGTSLNIATEGSPFIATGVTPDTMTIGKITANEPCISRGSIVAAGEGMYYASPNGIQLLNTGGTQNYTQEIYEKEFHYSLQPTQWASAKYGSSYAGFIKGQPIPSDDPLNLGYHGFVIDEGASNAPFTYLRFSTLTSTIQVVYAYSDELSGQIFGLMSNGTVMQWNPPQGVPGQTTLRPWQWKTKKFRFTAPQQFKAFMVLFEVPPEVQITLGVRNTDQNQIYNPATQYIIARVYADNLEIVVREVQQSGEVLLIPGGFKAELWEFQFEGQVGLRFFKVASSVKELKAT